MSLVGFGLDILAATKLVIVVTVNNTLYVHKHIRHRYRLMTAVQEIINNNNNNKISLTENEIQTYWTVNAKQ